MTSRTAILGAVTAAIAFVAMSIATDLSHAQSQVVNPLYVQARNLMQQVTQAPLDAGTKSRLQSRFKALTDEQQNLWRLAGEVDRKACTGACVTSYNNRIVSWQGNLRSFNTDATAALQTRSQQKQPSGQKPQAGCVRAGTVRPSPTAGMVLWNFSNSCNDTRQVSVCAEYGNGQNNPLGSDVGPRNSADIVLRAGYANLCWREGRGLPCPCPRR